MRSEKLHHDLGIGLGLRPEHYSDVLAAAPGVIDWVEILTDNFLVPGGPALYYLDAICAQYPASMHGVAMSLGGSDPLNWEYLRQVKALAQRIKPQWISDHLCWTGVSNIHLHDLMPLPYIDEAISHVASRIKQVQDFLEQRIVLENVSSYITYKQSSMSEWDFLNAVASEADCLILLDVNNIYVSSYNHDFDPTQYINAIAVERVQQFHIAGHSNCGEYIVDTHDARIIEDVWQLYALACERFQQASTLIERDDNIPPFGDMLAEIERARLIKASSIKQGTCA